MFAVQLGTMALPTHLFLFTSFKPVSTPPGMTQLLQHLGDFPARLSERWSQVWDYVPLPPLAYPELAGEMWCHRYYLRRQEEGKGGGDKCVGEVLYGCVSDMVSDQCQGWFASLGAYCYLYVWKSSLDVHTTSNRTSLPPPQPLQRGQIPRLGAPRPRTAASGAVQKVLRCLSPHT